MSGFEEWFGGNIYKSALASVGLFLTLMSMVLVAYRRRVTKENFLNIGLAFKETVAGLSSPNLEVRMSSAILLRRFLDKKSEFGVGGMPFGKSTVSVVAAVLKTLQTSDFQKVLSDTLRFAPSKYLKKGDFQRANLSKAYLGGKQVNMEGADFFQANLSGTHLKKAVLNGAQFYEATMIGTILKGAKLKKANFDSAVLQDICFKDADLTGAKFSNARLRNVDFTNAKMEGVEGENAIGYDVTCAPPCIKPPDNFKGPSTGKIFISRPGVLDARQCMAVESVKDIVKQSELSFRELSRDMYDASNVLSKLSSKIGECSAMIVFGLKSMHIVEGEFRYSTEDSRPIQDKFISTPWNHIEAGMAIMHRIPVLLIVEDGIYDGIFHNNINDELLTKLSINCCLDEKKKNVASWLESIQNNVEAQGSQ